MKHKTILVVEDQADIRKLLRLTLSGTDWHLHETDNARHALELAIHLLPDIILLDINLSAGIDGYQLCRQLKSRADTANSQIIMLSARSQRDDIAAGLSAGADQYLVKPFSPMDLLQRLQTRDYPAKSTW